MADKAPRKIALADKFALFTEHWAPRLAARYNGNEVRLARVEGDYHWHSHPETDELFLVIAGKLDIEFCTHVEHLEQGDLIVVPAGTEHRPRASQGEACLLVMDAEGTPNTGDEETAFVPIEV